MKEFFIDMRVIPQEIRLEVAFIILRKRTGQTQTIKHATNDLLLCDFDTNQFGWYCYDDENKSIPVITLEEFYEHGGPVPKYRPYKTLKEAADCVGEKVIYGDGIYVVTGVAVVKDFADSDGEIRIFFGYSSFSNSADAVSRLTFLRDGKPVGVPV